MTDTRVPDEAVEAGAFAAWASTTPFHSLTEVEFRAKADEHVSVRDLGGGTTLEHDMLLDWELNKPTYSVLSRAALEAALPFLSPQAGEAVKRWHLDTKLHRMVEHGYGEWVRWDDASSSSPSIERGDDLGGAIGRRLATADAAASLAEALASPRPIGDEKARWRVKPLVWEKNGYRWHAKTPLGSRYTISGADYRGQRTVHMTMAGAFGDAVGSHVAWVNSEDEGFAAAQSDYEARINSAIEDGEANGA